MGEKKRKYCEWCLKCRRWYVATGSCPYCHIAAKEEWIKICEQDLRDSTEGEIKLHDELKKWETNYNEQTKRENILRAKIEAYKTAITLICGHEEK